MAREINLSKIYPEYRAYAAIRRFASVKEELCAIERYAEPYQRLVEKNGESELAEFASIMAAFDTSTTFPAAMAIAVHCKKEDVQRSLLYLASYVVRRTICSLDAKNLTKNAVALVGYLQSNGFSADYVRNFFSAQKAESSRFPSDTEFASAFLTRPMYGGGWDRRTRAILLRLDEEAQGKFDDAVSFTDDFTLEHVMPVRWKSHWPLQSGTTAEVDSAWELTTRDDIDPSTKDEIQERISVIDTIGNLVLVNQAKNSKLSNAAFPDKLPLLKDSAVKLTRQVGTYDVWDVDKIRQRSKLLAELAIRAWPDVQNS